MTIPTRTCVSGFIASMGALERTTKGVHLVRARVGVNSTPPRPPEPGRAEPGQAHSPVYFYLYLYGDVAERVSRRFRKGDVFIACGRLGYAPSTGNVFVANHIGHDAQRTTHHVVRTPTRRSHSQRIQVEEQPTCDGLGAGGMVPAVPAPAGAS